MIAEEAGAENIYSCPRYRENVLIDTSTARKHVVKQ